MLRTCCIFCNILSSICCLISLLLALDAADDEEEEGNTPDLVLRGGILLGMSFKAPVPAPPAVVEGTGSEVDFVDENFRI